MYIEREGWYAHTCTQECILCALDVHYMKKTYCKNRGSECEGGRRGVREEGEGRMLGAVQDGQRK